MQSEVSVAALLSGGFIAVWTGQDGFNDLGIRAQIYDENGRPVGSEFAVNLATERVQAEPTVIALPSGGFIVTWSDESAGYPSVFDVQGQVFDAQGHRVGSQFTANTTTVGFQVNSAITLLPEGDFVVAWESHGDSTYDDIRAQVFSADGTKVGGEIIVNDANPGDKAAPNIVGLAGGGFVVGWFEWSAGGADGPGSRAQLFDSTGNKVGDAFSLNSFEVGSQQQPTLAALPSGGFAAAYADGGLDSLNQDTGHGGIWIQLFDANGNRLGFEIRASSVEDINDMAPVIELVPGTGFVVAWSEGNGYYDDPRHIQAQMFDFSGNRIGEQFSLESSSDQDQNLADLALLSNGALVVGWRDLQGSSYNDDDVRARILFPIVHGTAGSDPLIGGSGRDFFMGHDGADTITAYAEDDGLSGGGGNDELNGGPGNDILVGGAGADELTGGEGLDLFVGTATELSGDTISDFAISDRIVISDLDLAGFTYSLSGSTLTYTGGSLNLAGFTGSLVASAAAEGGVQLVVGNNPPPPATNRAKLILTEAGQDVTVGGNVAVLGTSAPGEVIEIVRGNVTLDASFNAGGDTVVLPGDAGSYTAVLTGSFVTLESGAVTVAIPVGLEGLSVQFGNSTRELRIEGGQVMLGSQLVTSTEQFLAASGPPLVDPVETGPDSFARLILTAPGQDVDIGGNVSVTGTSAPGEVISVLGGNVRLDASFNAGGDTVVLQGASGDYTASLSGSFVTITDGDLSVAIPVGIAGLTVDFTDTDLSLRIEGGQVRLGDQVITASGAGVWDYMASLDDKDGDLGMDMTMPAPAFIIDDLLSDARYNHAMELNRFEVSDSFAFA
jgi:hypothetical protein